MTVFDTILIVDWSAGNDRGAKPKKDAIWAGVYRDGHAQPPTYLRNRQAAESWLAGFFVAERNAGRRVLAGFDFPFGYPAGFAKALTGSNDPFALWSWFEGQITDLPNDNNRFDLAGEINQRLGAGHGPFWFNPLRRDIDGLARNKTGYRNSFPEKRVSESHAQGSFTCWQMGGAGAVGGQVMTGLPVVNRLRRRFDAKVWPFEAVKGAPLVFVEIWPSLTVGPPPPDIIKDAWQVTELAAQIARQSGENLSKILDVSATEEGWIFGLGYEEQLRKA
jgi:molybdopterin molybdotransferase